MSESSHWSQITKICWAFQLQLRSSSGPWSRLQEQLSPSGTARLLLQLPPGRRDWSLKLQSRELEVIKSPNEQSTDTIPPWLGYHSSFHRSDAVQSCWAEPGSVRVNVFFSAHPVPAPRAEQTILSSSQISSHTLCLHGSLDSTQEWGGF